MLLELHDNAINNELWEWIRTTKHYLQKIDIINIHSELKISINFDNGLITLSNNDIKVIHNMSNQTQVLYYNGVIIEKNFIFENEYELKHYPFLDQFLLNGIYVDLALNLECIIKTFESDLQASK